MALRNSLKELVLFFCIGIVTLLTNAEDFETAVWHGVGGYIEVDAEAVQRRLDEFAASSPKGFYLFNISKLLCLVVSCI